MNQGTQAASGRQKNKEWILHQRPQKEPAPPVRSLEVRETDVGLSTPELQR